MKPRHVLCHITSCFITAFECHWSSCAVHSLLQATCKVGGCKLPCVGLHVWTISISDFWFLFGHLNNCHEYRNAFLCGGVDLIRFLFYLARLEEEEHSKEQRVFCAPTLSSYASLFISTSIRRRIFSSSFLCQVVKWPIFMADRPALQNWHQGNCKGFYKNSISGELYPQGLQTCLQIWVRCFHWFIGSISGSDWQKHKQSVTSILGKTTCNLSSSIVYFVLLACDSDCLLVYGGFWWSGCLVLVYM